MVPSNEAISKANKIVDKLAKLEIGDYSSLVKRIAYEVYEIGFWEGNWDVYFNPADYGFSLPAFRVMQEDEFDQHFDEADDVDAYYVGSAYIIL